MGQRERETHALHADELRTRNPALRFGVACFLKDLLKSPHIFGLFKEESHSLFEVAESFIFAAAA